MTEPWLEDAVVIALGCLAVLGLGDVACRAAISWLERGGRRARRSGGYPGAGRLIGLLERGIAFACIVAGAPGGIAALLVVKTVARFGETRDDRAFAEQFIVGTLISIGIAVGGAVVVRALLGFTPTVPG